MKIEKKSSDRKCVGCGEMKDKSCLIRVVRNKEGIISVDKTGKADGRGAYVCNNRACFEKCRKAKRFDKAFRTSVPDTVYAELEERIDNG